MQFQLRSEMLAQEGRMRKKLAAPAASAARPTAPAAPEELLVLRPLAQPLRHHLSRARRQTARLRVREKIGYAASVENESALVESGKYKTRLCRTL